MPEFDFDDLVINEDWYDDEARRQLRWSDSDKVLVGYGAAHGAVKGATSNTNYSSGQGAAAGAIGAVLGVAIAKGITFLVYKGKAKSMKHKRERAYTNSVKTKDMTNTIIEFMNSPTIDSPTEKRKRVNGIICVYVKKENFGYYMTFDNEINDYILTLCTKSGNKIKTLVPKNKKDAKSIISKYIAPYVNTSDFEEFLEKGYGYTIHITDCPLSSEIKELFDIATSDNKVREFSESYNDINDLM